MLLSSVLVLLIFLWQPVNSTAQQQQLDMNERSLVMINQGAPNSQSGSSCNQSIALLIKPCLCLEIDYSLRGEEASAALWGIWFNCDGQQLNDDQMSHRLNLFLSSDNNIRDMTRVVDLSNNLLTRIPIEMNQFRRLEKVVLSDNKITSIPSGEILGNYSTRRLIRLFLNNNKISDIGLGVFAGE
jgi:Leucine-rich repeat (LRR) protein